MKIASFILLIPYLLIVLPIALLLWTICCLMAWIHKHKEGKV